MNKLVFHGFPFPGNILCRFTVELRKETFAGKGKSRKLRAASHGRSTSRELLGTIYKFAEKTKVTQRQLVVSTKLTQ
eukprot:6075398-Amphidinium_carterae.1